MFPARNGLDFSETKANEKGLFNLFHGIRLQFAETRTESAFIYGSNLVE